MTIESYHSKFGENIFVTKQRRYEGGLGWGIQSVEITEIKWKIFPDKKQIKILSAERYVEDGWRHTKKKLKITQNIIDNHREHLAMNFVEDRFLPRYARTGSKKRILHIRAYKIVGDKIK